MSPSRPPDVDARVALLVDNLDRAFRGPSWHGTTLRGTLRGLTPARALRKPAPERNSIWELVLHAAYWKYVVRRKLAGDARGSFPREGSNFPELPERTDAAAWKADLKLLDAEHEALRQAVLELTPSRLERSLGTWRTLDLVLGAAAHDLHHAGQINLLKRL
jgi:hypothetical protein